MLRGFLTSLLSLTLWLDGFGEEITEDGNRNCERGLR